MPTDIALKFGPNFARNRNTSLIRRISALGLGTTATPPKKPDSRRDYFDVGGGPSPNRTGEFTGLGWRFPPASGGDYDRPQVAICPGPCSVIEGATENAATVQALLDNLVGRGLDPAICRLFIVDGAKALSKAIRQTFGRHTPHSALSDA